MDIICELRGITANLLAGDTSSNNYISLKQIQALNSLLNMGLQDKSPAMRHQVLHSLTGKAMFRIAGVDVQSAKNLTSPVATFLIGQLLEPDSKPWRLSSYGKQLISGLETFLKESTLA